MVDQSVPNIKIFEKGNKYMIILWRNAFQNKTSGFNIIVIYVDLNIIVTYKEVLEAIIYLKKEFKMKEIREIKYCIGLQLAICQVEYFAST